MGSEMYIVLYPVSLNHDLVIVALDSRVRSGQKGRDCLAGSQPVKAP